jgi:hypothetical protein
MLALIGTASYLFFVHRLADSFRTSSPHSVTLTQLYFPLLAVVSSQEDFHLQDLTHAGSTTRSRDESRGFRTLATLAPTFGWTRMCQTTPLLRERKPSPLRAAIHQWTKVRCFVAVAIKGSVFSSGTAYRATTFISDFKPLVTTPVVVKLELPRL